MKRLSHSLFCLALFIAAPTTAMAQNDASPARNDAQCSTRIEERNRSQYQAFNDALRSGDVELAYSFWADDATVTVHGTLPYAGTYGAKDPAYIETLNTYWTDNRSADYPPALYADCDKLILRGRWVATAVPTGIAVDQTVIEFFTFNADGKIVRDDYYFEDTAVIDAVLTP